MDVQSAYPRGMKSSRAEAREPSASLRSAPAVSSAELSIKIARRCGAPKKLAGPPPPTIPTLSLRWLMASPPSPIDSRVLAQSATIAEPSSLARGVAEPRFAHGGSTRHRFRDFFLVRARLHPL